MERYADEAFAELLRLHAPGLASLLRRRAPSPDLRGDALQEALARAWAARQSYDPRRPFGPWLATLALRIARDLARSRARRIDRAELPEDEEATAVGDAAGAAPDAALERDDEVARLRAALAELPDAPRRAFVRFHQDGIGLQELAQEMGMPLNTVKSHLRRARQRLAAVLRGGDGAS